MADGTCECRRRRRGRRRAAAAMSVVPPLLLLLLLAVAPGGTAASRHRLTPSQAPRRADVNRKLQGRQAAAAVAASTPSPSDRATASLGDDTYNNHTASDNTTATLPALKNITSNSSSISYINDSSSSLIVNGTAAGLNGSSGLFDLDADGVAMNESSLMLTYAALLRGNSSALLQLSPRTRGYVRKGGAGERLHWSHEAKYAVAREAIFDDWRAGERLRQTPAPAAGEAPTCAAARHPPVPHHHCHVFVSHAYRTMYVRSPKSASTSIMDWLGQCGWNATRNWNSPTCMSYNWERLESPASAAALWREYFVFGFVRNPWARAYSLYKDMTATDHFIDKHGPRCRLEWGRFCRDPWGEYEAASARNCTRKPLHYAYWHMMDHYHCMVGPTGDWAVDFVGSVERGEEDWAVVVAEMNRRRRPGVPRAEFTPYGHVHKVDPTQAAGRGGGGGRREQRRRRPQQLSLALLRALWPPWWASKGGGDGGLVEGAAAAAAADPYGGDTAHCADAVAAWYGCDVEHFGFLGAVPAAATTGDDSDGTSTTTAATSSSSTTSDVASAAGQAEPSGDAAAPTVAGVERAAPAAELLAQ